MSNLHLKETLAAVKEALRKGVPAAFMTTALQSGQPDDLRKAFTQGLGLTNYDLQEGALKLYPYMESLTPLRNRIARVAAKGDTSTKWRAITGINTNGIKLGVSEGNRGAVITTTVANYSANYVGQGLEDYVTWEGDYAAEGWEDLKADAVLGLLQSYMLSEEKMLLGGNASVALGTANTPSLVAAANGSLTTTGITGFSVIVVELTHDGWLNTGKGSVSTGVVQTIAKSNIDSSSDTLAGGAGQQSTNATVDISGVTTGTGSVKCVVTPKRGAVAWAWFCGATAGTEKLAYITTVPYVEIKALNGSGQTAASLTAADHSADSTYQYDGFLSQALKTGNNAYYKNLQTSGTATATLTGDGGGGVIEINDMLQTMWDTSRLGPQRLMVNSAQARKLYNLVIANGGAPLVRFMKDMGGAATNVVAGGIVGDYLNPITGELIKIEIHPDMIPGTILAISDRIPYKLNGIGNVYQVKCRKDYYMQDWIPTKRRWEYGVYADTTFQHYAPFSMGVIQGIS